MIPDGASLGARVFFGLLALSLLSIAATSVFAIVSRGNGTEDVAGRFGPIRAGVVVAMATAGTAFALVLGTPVLAWLREGERPGFAAIAFPAGLVVSCATVVVLMATMPISPSPVPEPLKIASFAGLGLLVVAFAWEAVGQFVVLLRHRDWFKASLWLLGVALVIGLVLTRVRT